jgi:hypothetical protein
VEEGSAAAVEVCHAADGSLGGGRCEKRTAMMTIRIVIETAEPGVAGDV